MRLVFMGTTPFSCVILEELLKMETIEVVGVVTQPDRPFGRKKKLKAPIVKEFALKQGLKVLQPIKLNDNASMIEDLNPDLIVTCAYGQIVSQKILDIPHKGSINVHASLLPKYRGGAPIHWSIINGENKTGVTLMEMDAGMDSGNMIAKESVSIEKDDTMGSVEKKLMDASRVLMRKYFIPFVKGEIKSEKQDESLVSFAYTIRAEDEYVDFNRDVNEVYNQIRGLIPWPVAHGILEGQRVKFHGVSMAETKVDKPAGTVLSVHDKGTDIACLNGYVTITKIQPFGKPALDALDFMNGMGRDWKGKVFQ